jgi:hypothetical protein
LSCTKKTDPRRLSDSCLINSNKKTELFSLSAARNEESIALYLGIHGGCIQLELGDSDAESLLLALQEMVYNRPLPCGA